MAINGGEVAEEMIPNETEMRPVLKKDKGGQGLGKSWVKVGQVLNHRADKSGQKADRFEATKSD